MKTVKIQVSSNGRPQEFMGPDLACEIRGGRLVIEDKVNMSLQAVFQESAWDFFVAEEIEEEEK